MLDFGVMLTDIKSVSAAVVLIPVVVWVLCTCITWPGAWSVWPAGILIVLGVDPDANPLSCSTDTIEAIYTTVNDPLTTISELTEIGPATNAFWEAPTVILLSIELLFIRTGVAVTAMELAILAAVIAPSETVAALWAEPNANIKSIESTT